MPDERREQPRWGIDTQDVPEEIRKHPWWQNFRVIVGSNLAEAITAREEAEAENQALRESRGRAIEQGKQAGLRAAASEARATVLEKCNTRFIAVNAVESKSLLLRWVLPNGAVIEWFLDDDEPPFPATVAECRSDRVHELVWATPEEASAYFRAALSTPEAR
jgi:hypothetical protein